MAPLEISTAYADRAVLITGGAGFIGSHLTDALVRHGAQVTVLDDLSTGREENLAEVADQIRFIRGSLLDADAVHGAVAGAEIVFHQAALTSVPRSVEEPELCIQINVMGTTRLLDAARNAGVSRIVSASSSSVYGGAGGECKSEDVRPEPKSPYAAAKVTGEHLLAAAAHCYGLKAISLRYFNIFGPRQRPDSAYAAVIPRFVSALREGARPTIYGDGNQTRDFTHVSNAVRANLLAGAVERRLAGEAINIACGRSHSVNELLRRIASFLSVPAEAEYVPPRIGEVQHSQAEVSRARDLIGYEPETGFEEGLAETLTDYTAL